MANRTVRINFKYDGALTDATSAVLSDSAGAYGIKRDDTDAVVVAADTAMTKVGTGQYEYTFAEPAAGLSYTAWVKFVYGGNTYYTEVDVEGTATADESAMTVSFEQLQQALARYLFGTRDTSGLSSDQVADINACIKDGLHAVYLAHRWSFLRPVYPITTVADTHTYDLPSGYDSLEGPLNYAADESDSYPPIQIIKESELNRRRADYEYTGRPVVAAITTKTFDDAVGSRRQITFYPTPDDAYELSAVMRLRPTMLSAGNPYPIGGEVLAPLFTEACLAAAERTFGETAGIHSARFQELLDQAIQDDKKASSPETLGFDEGSDSGYSAVGSSRVRGDVPLTWDGESL